ncbi:unnamed protein product, partial [Mesorhabditis spiculigera]
MPQKIGPNDAKNYDKCKDCPNMACKEISSTSATNKIPRGCSPKARSSSLDHFMKPIYQYQYATMCAAYCSYNLTCYRLAVTKERTPLNDAMKTFVSNLLMTSRNQKSISVGNHACCILPYNLACYRLDVKKAVSFPADPRIG